MNLLVLLQISLNELDRTIEEIKIVVDHAPYIPQSQDVLGTFEALEPQREKGDHPIRVQIQREVLDLEATNSNEVDRSAGQIFLYFLKMRLMDVYALQKVAVAYIRVRGSNLGKHLKQSVNQCKDVEDQEKK